MKQITTEEINDRIQNVKATQKSIIIKTSDGKALWYGTADEGSAYKVAVQALETTYNCQFLLGNTDIALHIEII